MADTTFTYGGDDKDHARAIDRMNRDIVKLRQQLAKASQQSVKGSKQSVDGFSAMNMSVKNLVSSLGGAGGLAAVYKVASLELQNLIDLQKKSSTAQISLSDARKGMLRNFGIGKDSDRKKLIEDVTKIALHSEIDEVVITQAVSSALSSRGTLSVKDALNSVRQSAKFLEGAPQEIPTVSAAALALAQVTGSSNAKANIGFMSLTGGESAVVSPVALAQNVAPAIIGVTQQEAKPVTAASLVSALTVGTADTQGATSGTAAIGLASQLRTALPDEKSLLSRIRKLQRDPEAARGFLDSASFEKKVGGSIEKLLTDKTSSVAEAFEKALVNIKAPGSGGAFGYDNIQGGFKVDPLTPQARLTQAYKSGTTQLLTKDILNAQGSVNREGLTNVLQAMGSADTINYAEMKKFELDSRLGTTGGIQPAIEILERRAKPLRTKVETMPVLREKFGAVHTPEQLRAEKSANEQLQVLNKILETLRDVRPREQQATNPPASLTNAARGEAQRQPDRRPMVAVPE